MNKALAWLSWAKMVSQEGGYFYLASPYTKYVDGHDIATKRAAEAVAWLLQNGVNAFSPIVHSHYVADHLPKETRTDHDFWIDADKPLMDKAVGLVILTIDGWEESRGVAEEFRIFEDAGKMVAFLDPASVDVHPEQPSPGAQPVQLEVISGSALRFDNGKLPMHLLPPEWEEGLAEVTARGAAKYAPRNWEQGMDWSRCFSPLRRHTLAWWKGEDKDPESGLNHLLHVAWNALALYSYSKRGKGKDDRPKVH